MAKPPPLRSDQVVYREQIQKGLTALKHLIQNPDVHTDLARICRDCEAVREQLEVVSHYKNLHDLLHELQFQVFDQLERQASGFPDDPNAMDSVMDHELTLERIVDDLGRMAEHRPLDASAQRYIQFVVDAQSALGVAIDEEDADAFKRARSLLRRVLRSLPARVNAWLKEAARATRLHALVEALASVHNYLGSLERDRERIDRATAQASREMLGQGVPVRVDHSNLRKLLSVRFSEEDLKTFVFDLADDLQLDDLDYDNLPSAGKVGKARELVAYFQRRDRVPELAGMGKRLRPDIPWERALQTIAEAPSVRPSTQFEPLLEQFREGLDAMRRLDRELPRLVEDHDAWQILDVELGLVADALRRDTEDLELSWPEIKAQVRPRSCAVSGFIAGGPLCAFTGWTRISKRGPTTCERSASSSQR
jgi:hypothetical protein